MQLSYPQSEKIWLGRGERVIELQVGVAVAEIMTCVFNDYISVIVAAAWSKLADPAVMIL